MKAKKTTKRHSPGSEITARMVGEDQGRMAVECSQFSGYLDNLDEEEAIEAAIQAENDSRYYDGHPLDAVLATASSTEEEEVLEEAYDKGVEDGIRRFLGKPVPALLGATKRQPKRLGRKRNPKLEWGLQPPADATMAWGARAIYKPGEGRYSIDLLWDRQSMEGGTASERKALSHWINTKGLKAMRLLAPRNLGADSGESVHWTDGKYMIEASPRESYGYLYIVAYPAPAGTSPEPKPPSNTEYVKAKRVAFRAAHGRRFNSRTTAIKKAADEIKKLTAGRTTARTASGSDVTAHELELFAMNDADLYPQRQAIEKNLAKKMQKGVYDHAKAVKLWMYFAESAAQKYAKEQGGTWHAMFTVPTRKLMAESIATQFETEAKVQGLNRPQPKVKRGRKTNSPRTRSSRRIAAKTAYRTPRVVTVKQHSATPTRLPFFSLVVRLGRQTHEVDVTPDGQILRGPLPDSQEVFRFVQQWVKQGHLPRGNPRGRCVQPRAPKGLYGVCPKGTASKPGKKCRQPRAAKGRYSSCK